MSEFALTLESREGYTAPFVVSLLLHAAIFWMLFFGWNFRAKTEPLQTPPYIKAELVQLNAQANAPKQTIPEKAQPEKVQPDTKPAPEPELEIQRLRELEREKAEKQKQVKVEKQKQDALEKKKREEKERAAKDKLAKEKAAADKAAAEKRKANEALSKAMAEEESFQQSLSDKALAQSYTDLIRRRVEANWNRPPSARQGLEVLLEIQLVPTGYVAGVSVLKGSGNSSFDLSAQQAVQKADRFPEIKDMPPRVFEQHFRRFKMLFRLEDDM